MKIFIKRFLLFIAPIVVMLLTAEFFLRRIPNDYSFKKNYLETNSKEIEVLILGNSHSYFDINPALIKSNAFNAAHNSQSLDYDLKLFEKYQWNNLKCVIVPVDYLSLFSNLESSVESWRAPYYAIYYDLYTSIKPQDNFEILSVKLKVSFDKLVKFYVKKDSGRFWSDLGWGNIYRKSEQKDLEATGINAARRHQGNSRSIYKSNTNNLESIVKLAAARNIKVLIITFPAYKSYVENLDVNQLETSIEFAESIAETYNNVKYINELNDFSFNQADFYDADHLNTDGAYTFSIKVDSILSSNWNLK
jgi:hypothetical protein